MAGTLHAVILVASVGMGSIRQFMSEVSKAVFLSYASPAFALALPSSSDFDETSRRGKQDAEGTR